MNKHKHYEVIVAWAEGKPIQYRPYEDLPWKDCKTPSWELNGFYRIKPTPLKYRPYLLKEGPAYWMGFCTMVGCESDCERGKFFVRWVSDWVEVEV